MLKHGPVDVLVLASGEPKFDGSILKEIEKQVSNKVIRVLDALILVKNETGVRMSIDIEDLPAKDKASLGFIDTATRGLFDSTDADTIWEGMVPGSAVVALAIEHAWAVDLANAILASGAEVALNFRVPALVIDEAYASLQAGA
ncbi:MAG: hypothetical protein C3F13_06845 [Anaerolineales bacterium]|nr:hypothetical protein [Anaerolineae bacterium]PWB54465.1 MAG: hypothetical protein C3F13_06845 [Anaerolineales bacterium]